MNNLDFGIVGNCRSAALISKSGAVEWLCLPIFDSASVFGALLDRKKGGSFEILTDDSYKRSQHYLPNTNILSTKFTNGKDKFEVIDFMPRYHFKENQKGIYAPPDFIRYIKWKAGKPKFKIKYDPQLEYAQKKTVTEERSAFIKSYTSNGTYDSLYLYTNLEKSKVLNNDEIELTDNLFFLVSYNQKLLKQSVERAYLKLQRTKVYWLNWAEETHN
ncbi:MAG TPA: trehalase-like domain-containing protein, partial [Prolixibacteraceae bacterium]|nr:trehalase-like domain-containing protein [Prolixibacteraceae bacterium]